jgi:hypothetical protein
MRLWVFSDRRLGSIAEWQAALDGEGYQLRLGTDKALDHLSGFFPMRLIGEFTGFEFHSGDPAEFARAYPAVDFGRAWKHALAFHCSDARADERRAAWMAATAYATATDGVIVDGQEFKIHAPSDARVVVRGFERDR